MCLLKLWLLESIVVVYRLCLMIFCWIVGLRVLDMLL